MAHPNRIGFDIDIPRIGERPDNDFQVPRLSAGAPRAALTGSRHRLCTMAA